MYKETFGESLFVFEQDVSELAAGYERPLSYPNQKHEKECTVHQSPTWYGGIKSLNDARSILDNGWSEGAAKALALKELLDIELPTPKVRKRRQVWAGDGESLDIDRAIAGQWDCAWRDTRREHMTGPTCVTLNIGWGGNCDRTSDELFWSGAIMLVLSDILEQIGYSVRLNAVCKTESNSGKHSMNIITVKNHGEPLRIDAVAGIVCHAGIFRTYGFRSICNAPWDVGWGLGHAIGWGQMQAAMDKFGYRNDPNSIVVNDCYTKEQAINEVTRILQMLNKEIEAR